MTCFTCRDTLENKQSTFMVDLKNCIVIIKNTPSQVCSQCGEISYSIEVAEQLELITKSINKNIIEIAVVTYSNTID